MKDHRVPYLREVLGALLDSLQATARLSSWDGTETAPEPLRISAAKLVERLGVANRLAADKFTGPPRVVESLNGISEVIRRLDSAYVRFRQHGDSAPPGERAAAVAELEAEIEDVKVAQASY